ncbi:ribonuclease III [Candidatus Wolfebacteria bacterium RIFCSPHIGHO2_01_FULL_48_22]|uniref:Ribonuclease 3 n=2 Tax=Candidatus Wolfeibacteriota TaxID=1752735 RepID=A0A1F8DRW0_9BACT|nr:MAG: ribonuclease III [Candidatus Wolfebacteria bacterium RIFCSPHIGHO2_01_FULL_48_22]OGM92338.1 MAG: ribonuclease III [Candidatus Wolfebacteria bacterium RIFCSPLOWO2_01_FULL_47_17b]
MDQIQEFEQSIHYAFKNKDVLQEALTHRSYLNENPSWHLPHNERLEFLGDAVLELIVTENLYHKYPDMQEGKLTSIRAALVNYQTLAKVAQQVQLEKYLFLSKGEMKDTGKAREVILANAFEALLGALYMDGGYDAVAFFIVEQVLVLADDIVANDSYRDAKSYFQEIAQDKIRVTPTYSVLKELGPDHKKEFVVGVFLKDKKIAEGTGTSKQEAEVDAAKNALKSFQKS